MTTTFSPENSIAAGLYLILNSLTDGADKSMVSRWLDEHNKKSRQKVRNRQVLEAVAEGYDTTEEIAAHTKIPSPSVHRILKRLTAAKKMRETRTKNANNRIELRYETL